MALYPLLWQMNTAHAAARDLAIVLALGKLPGGMLLALGIIALQRGRIPSTLSPVGQRPPLRTGDRRRFTGT